MRQPALLGLLGLFSLTPHAAPGQPAPKLEFEVASVRQSGPQSTGPAGVRQWKNGGAGSNDPGTLTYTLMPFWLLIHDAYGVERDQIVGPAWIDERYDIAAKVPLGVTLAEQNLMLRDLLIDRFHMSVRLEAREAQGYVLTVAKDGPKFHESVADPAAKRATDASCRNGRDKDGIPQMPAGCRGQYNVRSRDSGMTYIVAREAPIASLVAALRAPLQVDSDRVVDKTGLTGNYDYRLGYSETGLSVTPSADALPVPTPSASRSASSTGATIRANPSGPASAPDLMDALEKQLGLKLEKTKVSVNMVIVDRADRVPAEN